MRSAGRSARAADDLEHANLVLFGLGCAALGAYYLVFVLGWMRILAEWGVELSYPAALRAEMLSMLAKYIPGGIWTPAARVVAARRAGVTDAALVTSSMLLEAGISAVAGVIVFVLSLAFVDNVHAPLAPLIVFGVILAILVQPRVFRPLAHKVLLRFGYTARAAGHARADAERAARLLRRDVGARRVRALAPAAVGRRASGAGGDRLPRRNSGGRRDRRRLFVFAPSGLGPREASMYGLLLAVTTPGRALGAVALNRVALTAVELVLLLVGGLFLRRARTTARV